MAGVSHKTDKKFRSGPFKSKRLCEIPILELYVFLGTPEAKLDRNQDLVLAILEEFDRRMEQKL